MLYAKAKSGTCILLTDKNQTFAQKFLKIPSMMVAGTEGQEKYRQDSFSSPRTLRWMGMAKARVRRSEMDWVI